MKTTFKLSSGSAAADDYCAEENGQGDSQWHKSRNRISLKISQIEYSGDQALKVEIGGTVKYLEGIVEKWDAMALAAVENYQNATKKISEEQVEQADREFEAEVVTRRQYSLRDAHAELDKRLPAHQKRIKNNTSIKTFERSKNANGIFINDELIDLGQHNSAWWTGAEIYAIYNMDEVEFDMFYKNIENLTKDLDEYGTNNIPVINELFVVENSKGKKYQYEVDLDGYFHGKILAKIDLETFAMSEEKYLRSFENGRYKTDAIRHDGSTWSRLGAGSEHGSRNNNSSRGNRNDRVDKKSSRSYQTRNDSGEAPLDNQVSSELSKTGANKGDIQYSRRDLDYLDTVNRGNIEQADRDVEAITIGQRQYQARGSSEEDVYPTEGVHWGIAAKIISEAEARAVWKAIADIEKRGYSYPKNIRGESFISSNNFLMVVDTDYRYPSIKAIYEFTEYYKSSFDSARRLIINARGIQSEERKAIQIIEDAYGPGYVIRHDIQDYSSYVWEDRRGERAHGGEPDSETQQHLKQYQLRTQSYTDREVLEMAAENMSKLKLTDREKGTLEVFNRRLERLKGLEQQRDEQRQILAELNKADKPDADEIRKAENRLNVLGRRISAAENDILAVEDKKTLKKVLHTARRVAERERVDTYREQRNTTAMRHKVQDIVKELNNYLLKGDKDKHVMIGLQKAVASALDVVNMDTVGAEERIAKLEAELMNAKTPEKIMEISRRIENVRKMGDKMTEKLAILKAAYADIRNSTDPLIANSHDEVIEAKIESVMQKVGDTSLRDMSLEQLEEVYDLYKMVLHTIRDSNKAFALDKKQSIDALASDVQREVEEVGGKKKLGLKSFKGTNSFVWNNFIPTYAFKVIGSKTLQGLYRSVRAGEDTWAKDISEARAFYLAQNKKYGFDSWDMKETFAFTSTSGLDFELTLQQMMSLYAYSKRDQAEDHLKYGGIVFESSVKKKKLFGKFDISLETEDATAYNISPETLAEIISKLSKEQRDFVDVMQDYLSSGMGEKGNEVSLAMYGVKLFKEKHYFPLRSSNWHRLFMISPDRNWLILSCCTTRQ